MKNKSINIAAKSGPPHWRSQRQWLCQLIGSGR